MDMEPNPFRSAVSILRTVLHLLEHHEAVRKDSATLLEFRRVTMKLIAEIQSEHGIPVELIRAAIDETGPDNALKPIKTIDKPDIN
jgi:hypothetical protein